MFLNKKGTVLTYIIIISTIIALCLGALVVWANSLQNNLITDENKMEQSSIAFYEWRKIELMTKDAISDKVGTSETITALSDKYNIKITYGDKVIIGDSFQVPVEITVTDKTNEKSQSYTLQNKFFSDYSGDRYVQNYTPTNVVGVKYDASENLIRYFVNGEEVKEKSAENFNTGNGWIEFNNGLIIQYGAYPTNFDGATKRIYFPKAFPNKAMSVVTSVFQDHWIEGIRFNAVAGFTKTYVDCVPTGGNGDYKIFWMAFGH